MKIVTTLLLFLLTHAFSNAQEIIKHSIYFPTDGDIISKSEQKKLDDFLLEIPLNALQSIELSGHTDSDASAEYNIDLSRRRVNSVQNQLIERSIDSGLIVSSFHGEEQPIDVNTSSIGKQNNRRVELLITLEAPSPILEEKKVETVVEPKCNYDTTLIFPQGTQITLNICDYLSVKDCFSLSEYNEGDAMRASNLTTMTSSNQPLISGGMFEIKLCSGVCAKVRIPVRERCGKIMDYSVWGVTPDGRWDEVKTAELNIVEIGGQKYYETEVCRSGKINFDVKVIKPPKVKVKAKGVDLINVKLSFDAPPGVYLPYKTTKHKAVFRLFCPCSEPLISATALNKDGDTLKMPYVNANLRLKKREVLGKCKTPTVSKKILFFKIREKAMYRKYILRKKDFQLKE